MDYQELKQLEDDLWESADLLRANSKLTASEYSMPVLGLIFLRHAITRFNALLRDLGIEAFKRAGYFIAQGHWLLSRFPNGLYEDVPGLYKVLTRQEIAANDWSLTPGRYVGVAVGQQGEEDGEAFTKRMREIHIELAELNDKAVELAERITSNFEALLQ